MPIIIDTTIPYLCQCRDDNIQVNKNTDLTSYNPVFSELEISLMNVSEDSKFENALLMTADDVCEMIVKGQTAKASYIVLEVPFGNNPDSFIDNDSTIMSTAVPGWTASSWRSSGDSLVCSILKNQTVASLNRFESIEITISKICSYCYPGMTYVKVRFCNVNGVSDMIKYIPIKKTEGKLQINQFVPANDTYVVSENEEVRLHWVTGAATGGVIHPVEYILDSKIAECVDRPSHSKEYILDITDGVSNITQMCPIFVSPPIICDFKLSEDESFASWSTKHCTKVLINNEETDPDNDKYEIEEVDRVVLFTSGYLYNTESTLFLVKEYEELDLLNKKALVFEGYTVIQLTWRSSYSSVKLNIYDPEMCFAVVEKEGFYEYVVEDISTIKIEFVGIKNDGSECIVDVV